MKRGNTDLGQGRSPPAFLLMIGVAGGPYAYIHFVEGHGRLAPVRRHVELRLAHQRPSTAASPTEAATSSASTSSAPRTSGSLDGAWTVGSGSTVGYRVHETLFGQSDAVVGRTSAIIGSLTVSGGTLTTGSFSADLTSSPVTAHLHPDEFRFVEMIRPESLIIEQF